MRWQDRSVVDQPDLDVGAVLELMAQEKVAMAIMAPDALPALQSSFKGRIADFGLGPLPQAGGNATLAGGSAWIFNARSAPEVRRAAFEWTINRDFNLTAFDADLQGQRQRGELVGWPQLPLFGGAFQQQRDAIVARYSNAPVTQYKPYTTARLRLQPEPPVATQQMYERLDVVIRTILTDETADPMALLGAAAREFDREVLAFE
jgi:ABC-type glycerol-3-phosphate transport system substrate-binding protein